MLQKKYTESIIFFDKPTFKVAELIFNDPHKVFHLRKLAKDTGLSTTTIASRIDKLHHFKIISIEKTDITTNIHANLDSEAYYFYKKIFNLYRLERYLLLDEIKNNFKPEAIILFGSFAKGEDIEKSDVDLLILSNRKSSENIKDFLEKVGKVLNRKINLHILPNLNKSSAEFKNAVANGIVLYGYLKVV